MSLLALIEEFASAMNSAGKTKSTRKTYAARLRAFDRWIAASGAVATEADYCFDVLTSFLLFRANQGDRPRTRVGYINAFTCFGGWLAGKGLIIENPGSRLERPKLDAAIREEVEDSVVLECLAACDRLPDATRAVLAKAVFSILTYCGVRRGELMALTMDDLFIRDPQRRRLVVRNGKGGKRRELPLPPEVIAALASWLTERAAMDCHHNYLFALDKRKRLGDNGLRALLREVAAVAGHRGAKNILPHSIRHNSATFLHRQKGVDLTTVQAFLGHSRLQTTSDYLHTNADRLHKMAEEGVFSREPEKQVPPQEEPRTAPNAQRNGTWRRRISTRR